MHVWGGGARPPDSLQSECAARSLRPNPGGPAGPHDSLREAAAPATSWQVATNGVHRPSPARAAPGTHHPHQRPPTWQQPRDSCEEGEAPALGLSSVAGLSLAAQRQGEKRYKPQQSLTQAPTPAGQRTILTSLLRKGLPQAALLSNSANWAPVRPGLLGHGQASESPHCRGQPPPAWPAGMGWSRASSPHGAPEKGQRSQVLHPHRHREELTLCPQPLPHAGGRGWESSGLWVG